MTTTRLTRRGAARWLASTALLSSLVLTGCGSPTTTGTTTAAQVADGAAAATLTDAAASAPTSSSTTTAGTITSTAAAADAFLATLSDEQVAAVTYAYDDETKTTSWSNFPVTFVERAGLNLTDLTTEQRTAAMAVIEALLGDEGYATVTAIIGGDEFLAANSSSTEDSLGQYYLAFFGDPSDSGAWEVQLGGHHLGINATLDGAAGSITFAPTHLGTQPAVYPTADGTEVQPLAGVYETAFAFYDSLTTEQQAVLYQGEEVDGNLACAPGDTCDFPTGTGLSGADLTDEQRTLLLDVIANWVGLADEETTATALAEIEATLDETVVSWSGATVYDMTQGDGIAFRISGPDVYVELASQQGSAGADVAGVVTSGWGHVHTIYRDPSDDYAGSVTQQAASGAGGGAGGGPGGGPAGAPGSDA